MTANDPSDTFRQEAQELLEQLEQALLDLAARRDDQDLIDSTFRALHTIKGSGSMFGFDAVAAFTHYVETAFDLVRKGVVPLSTDILTVALTAKDHIRNLIEHPGPEVESQGSAILANLERVIDNASSGNAAASSSPADDPAPAPVFEPANAPRAAWRVRLRLPKDAMATGTNPLLLLDELAALGDATIIANTDNVPVAEELDPFECHIGWEIRLITDRPKSAIEDVFLFVLDEMELAIEPLTDQEAAGNGAAGIPATETSIEAAPVRVEAGPQATPDTPAPAPIPAPARSTIAPAAAPEPRQAKTEAAAQKGMGSIRVPAERLDDLMDRVGELVIAQSRLKQVAASSTDAQVKSIAEEIERLALELRDTTMGVRMVPIASLFGRFRRLVHDLAGELGKEIILTTSGEETELDKTVIERLNDPLVHLIRNAIDHGLEPAQQRVENGKQSQGNIRLAARHTGDKVLISISDDGKGLDRNRIQAKAEENGLLAPGTKLSDSELFQIIFQPGFSTAQQVTNLSGRGVGMDVVKKTIDALRGTIDITSTPGAGTTITLRLPLTLAIIDGLLVRVGAGRYVIPLSAVEECVELPAEEDGRSRGRNFLNIRGDLVPFLRLRDLFNATQAPDPFQKVVIVSSGETRVGLVVDQVIGDHQTVIKSLSKLHAKVGTFSGATILGDGTVALILEIAHLVARGQQRDERLRATG
ncbi:MAG: chemotaxis protein CheA [Rhodospirillaceae bacterium]|nr:MAG: chemotaxis protein CheA [Rhodospirillaceae bacterium]